MTPSKKLKLSNLLKVEIFLKTVLKIFLPLFHLPLSDFIFLLNALVIFEGKYIVKRNNNTNAQELIFEFSRKIQIECHNCPQSGLLTIYYCKRPALKIH